MRRLIAVFLVAAFVFALPLSALAAKEYTPSTQAELTRKMDSFLEKDVSVEGTFLFTGSDFCYQVRKTKINTRDYFCFALGPVNLIRFYLKKNHIQVPELMALKKGAKIRAYGQFDAMGRDYKYMIVDHFEVVE